MPVIREQNPSQFMGSDAVQKTWLRASEAAAEVWFQAALWMRREMEKREIDIRCRNKDYTAEIALNHLPANDKQIPGVQDAGTEDVEETEIRILNPCMSIDIYEILDSWMREWNETPETNTEEWVLTAFPVLADGRVALLFESEILEYEVDEEGDLTSRTIENHYRVLVYDPKNVGQVDRYRFKIFGGYAATIFFKEGKLYAPVSVTGKSQYTALRVWPGSDDEHQILIGDDINCLAVTGAGDVIVSYDRSNDLREETEEGAPLISIFRTDGTQQDIPRFSEEDTGDFVIDVTLDTQERIWTLLSDAETAVIYDTDGSIMSYSLPVSNVSALAVPKDRRCIYATSEDEKAGCILFRIPMTTEGEEDEEPVLCAVRTPEGDALINQSCSFLKNIMAAIIDNVLYIIDLDEQ